MQNGVVNLWNEKREMHLIGQFEKSRDHTDFTD